MLATRRRGWGVDLRGCDVHRLMVSFWSCVGYVGYGASVVVFGPTILDLGEQLGVSVGILSTMLGCRAVGAALGSLGSGLAVDRLVNHSYIFMSFVILYCLTTTAVLPLSVNVSMLVIFMFLNGMAVGALDSGTHAVLMRLWKEESGPCMQVLHFAFAFGAFLAPLIAKQFISAEQDDDEATNFTSYSGSGWAEGNCTAMMQCATCTNSTGQEKNFKIAYWISSSIFIPALLAYVFYSVKYDIMKHLAKKKKLVSSDSADAMVEEEHEEEGKAEDQDLLRSTFREELDMDHGLDSSAPRAKEASLWFVVTILTMLGTFMFLYVGLEVSYGYWAFTVVVTGTLGFSKHQGTVVQSLFWGTFAFTRLFSVVLALLNVKASVMMTGNLTGSVIASVIMVSLPHNAPAIWLASAVLGMSYASIYPTAMTWMSETVEATGKATSVLVTCGMVGYITIPAVAGSLIAQVTPDSLFYMTFAGSMVSALLTTSMFTLSDFKKRRQTRARVFQTAHKMTTTSGFSESDEEQLLTQEEESMLDT